MQFEIISRPGKKPPGTVTKWPTQQKILSQVSKVPVPRTMGTTPVQKQSANYKIPMPRPTTNRQQPNLLARQPAYSRTGDVNTKRNQPVQRSLQSGFNRIASAPFQRTQPVSKPINKSYLPGPVIARTVNRPPESQTFYNSIGNTVQPASSNKIPIGYQRPYIFNPVPGIPSKTPLGNTGNTIPNPGKGSNDIPNKQPCTCGQTGNGCTTLSDFALGSDQPTPNHHIQIRDLAKTILEKGTTIVITTGHTDANGTEEDNIVLGRRRSRNITLALKRELNNRAPGSSDTIFWKTDTKGEAEPVSDTDDSANRRVVVCLKKTDLQILF